MNPLDLFTDYTYAQALCGTVVVGLSAGAVGPLLFLRRTSLLTDVVAHSSLPGIVAAFLVASLFTSNGRIPPVLLLGALASGLLAVWLVRLLPRLAPLHPDAVLAATLSSFFALGMVGLQFLSRHPLPGQAGLADYLLGNASTLTRADVITIAVVGGGAVGCLLLVHHAHAVTVSDTAFAQATGVPVRVVNAIAYAALVTVTVVGITVVGVVLMVAACCAPAAAARQLTRRLVPFIVTSSLLGGASAAVGCYISIACGPLPTGPIIILVQAACVLAALLLRKVLPCLAR
ncbi:metal ABC transporter permease [Corynebacterium lizhenjunii]|uniref:Metal ABC transporter permease n=1 Tax=Corynebacterium lizhenjunii TaxID=2709394 RepID=A0A7T0KFN2_9CORY|nr:metal ABC transporter permease [Corynebacterium lizhenjunii]QPK79435.1 metal ABC transporter permease [Corynebacterium lizhenjunii]